MSRDMTDSGLSRFIAVDWGTTNFRAFLMNSNGACLDSVASSRGVLSVTDGAFLTVLKDSLAGWLNEGSLPIIMSGMVGSKVGWVDVPYIEPPIDRSSLIEQAHKIALDDLNIWIVPGVKSTSIDGYTDVMRGEEVQVLGAKSIASESNVLHSNVCLPGTHSKWFISDGSHSTLTTFMTGEVFSLLSRHSILSRSMEDASQWSDSDFLEGVAVGANTNLGLLHSIFSVRTRTLFQGNAPVNSRSLLSGMLIGSEISSMLPHISGGVTLVAESNLLTLYSQACEVLGCSVFAIDSTAASQNGLFNLYAHMLELGEI